MENKTIKELYGIAKSIGVKGYMRMSKENLIIQINIKNEMVFNFDDNLFEKRKKPRAKKVKCGGCSEYINPSYQRLHVNNSKNHKPSLINLVKIINI